MYFHPPQPRSDSAVAIGGTRKPILPHMKVRKERTEIVFHHDRSFITKLPQFTEVDTNVQTVFDNYRGTSFLSRDVPSRDERFTRLQRILTPSNRVRGEEYPTENVMSRAKPKRKHFYAADSPAMSDTGVNYAEARVMIASRGQSRGQSRDNSRSAPGLDYLTEKKSAGATRPAEILHSFKNKDIKELSNTLRRESHIDATAWGVTPRGENKDTPRGGNNKDTPRGSGGGKDTQRTDDGVFVTRKPSFHVPSLGLNIDLKHK